MFTKLGFRVRLRLKSFHWHVWTYITATQPHLSSLLCDSLLCHFIETILPSEHTASQASHSALCSRTATQTTKTCQTTNRNHTDIPRPPKLLLTSAIRTSTIPPSSILPFSASPTAERRRPWRRLGRQIPAADVRTGRGLATQRPKAKASRTALETCYCLQYCLQFPALVSEADPTNYNVSDLSLTRRFRTFELPSKTTIDRPESDFRSQVDVKAATASLHCADPSCASQGFPVSHPTRSGLDSEMERQSKPFKTTPCSRVFTGAISHVSLVRKLMLSVHRASPFRPLPRSERRL